LILGLNPVPSISIYLGANVIDIVNLLGFLSLSLSLDQKGCESNKQLDTKQNHFSVHKQSAICSLGQRKNAMLHSSLMDVIFQQLPPPPAPPSSAQPQHPVPNELSEELGISQTWVPSIPYIVRTSPSFDTMSIIFRNVEIFTPNFYFFSEKKLLMRKK
jgi:hypothetical protein